MFENLCEQLGRTFTHKNDYWCEKFEYMEVDGKMFISPEPYDCTSMSVTHIEFPKEEDIKAEYISIYGEDFDKIEINIQ
jgi:hypothetical protein